MSTDNDKTKEQLVAELQEARQQLAEWNSIFELLPDLIVKSNAQDIVEFASRDLPVLKREEMMGRHHLDLTLPEEREQVAGQIEQRRAGETIYTETKRPGPDGQTIWSASRSYPIIRNNQYTGSLSIVSDITHLKQAEAERARLQQELIEAQHQAIKELSAPVIPVMERIIVMPLIGSIDSMRARDITRSLLAGIREKRAKVVILDITGVPLVDSGVANHLNKTIQAARLKGARTIVTGISDAVAETIVELGIDWGNTETLADLQTGLIVALHSLGIKLSQE